MCKICGNSRKPVVKKIERSSKVQEFIYVCTEYSGESPCERLIEAYNYNSRHYNQPIDALILSRLESSVREGFEYRKFSRTKHYMFNKRPTDKSNTNVEKNIQKAVRASGSIRYIVSIRGKNKVFKTLEEAQQYKKETNDKYKRT
jgi:hypothetical protein